MFLTIILGFVLAYTGSIVYKRYNLAQRQRFFEEKYGCKSPQFVTAKPWWDQYGLVFLRGMLKAANEHKVLEHHRRLLLMRDTEGRGFGNFVTVSRFGTKKVLFTDDVENVKSAVARAEDFVVEPARLKSFGPLLGKGIFTSDGSSFWQHSRSMPKPQFEKGQITELEQFERHIPNLLAHIPDDGSTVDLQSLFHNFTMDTLTEFLTGTSTSSLSTSEQGTRAKDFVATFEKSMDDCTLHARLGKLYNLLPRFTAKRGHSTCRQYIEKWVDRAMTFKHEGKEKAKKGEQYCFLTELVKHDEVDRTRAVNETINILLAGTRYDRKSPQPSVLPPGKRAGSLEEATPPHSTHPSQCSAKHASRDTLLPHGGGPCGLEPLFMAKDDIIVYNTYSMHRSTAIYGSDSDTFRPERWADPNLRPLWNYIPFGGGQRVCLGQSYALSESYDVTVRLMQEFGRIEGRDESPWMEKLSATLASRNGVRVGLWKG